MESLLPHDPASALLPVSQRGMAVHITLWASHHTLSQLDGCLDAFVSKVRAHLKQVRSPNADGTCLTCQYPLSNPHQPFSALPALLPAFLRLIP